ncbi:MAG: hypothetical protein ACOCXP_02090, partial [Candidatus Dojkabacteria bacterium]
MHMHVHGGGQESSGEHKLTKWSNYIFASVGALFLLGLIVLALNNNLLIGFLNLNSEKGEYYLAKVESITDLTASEVPEDTGIPEGENSYLIEAELISDEKSGEKVSGIVDPFNSGLINRGELRFEE